MPTFQEYFDNYIAECEFVKRLRPATIKTSKDAFTLFSKTMPELSEVEDIDNNAVTAFFKRLQLRERTVGKGLRKVGIKDSTLISYASRLKTFFKWLVERKQIQSNPFDNVHLPRPEFVDHRALTGDEIRRIMGAVAQQARDSFLLRRDMAMIAILTFCGLRRNELATLELINVDILGGFITIQPHTSKSKRLRKIPINPYLKFYLKEYLAERKKRLCKTPYLFVSYTSDRGLSLDGLKHWVNRLSKASGVKFHLHRFRHTFATNLGIQDVGVVKIQKLMGHRNLEMTQTYLRSITTEKMGEDVGKLSFDTLA